MNERYTDSFRFIFVRNNYTNKMELVDKLEHFSPVSLQDELAEVLSQILYEHGQFTREKEEGLFELNNLRDFVKENNDLDNEIIINLLKYR